MTGALADVRVVDISPFLPGPFATQMLADLGATVIKVEPPTGDPGRTVPGGLYEVANRNKASITLDLKSALDRERCHRLVAGADVFVEGFRPGVADRLGISYDELSRINPALVYCSVSGYGQHGPKRFTPGHDVTYLAASGALAVPGSWSDPRPHRTGLPIADLGTSAYVAVAVLAALRARQRSGRGCRLDVAIADVALAMTATRAGERLDNSGEERLHLNPSNDLFDTADGVVAVAAVEEHFWDRLRAELTPYQPQLSDERFDDLAGRREHGEELSALLGAVFMSDTAKEWARVLGEADVPAEVVRPIARVLDSDHVRDRGLVEARDGQRHVTFPVLCDARPMGQLRTNAPIRGQHTYSVITALDAGNDAWAAVSGGV
ncbi:MAG: CaiB/BaiF CoA transferase family protein [Gaiellales bacterium]